MGHLKRTSSDTICLDISSLYRECCDTRNDGWTAFEYKKDILKIKYHLENLINKCPTFIGETEFIEELEKEITWEILQK